MSERGTAHTFDVLAHDRLVDLQPGRYVGDAVHGATGEM